VNNTWSKGRLDGTTDENGIGTAFTYESGESRAHEDPLRDSTIVTTYVYDAVGHVLTETVSNPGTSETLVTNRVYDTAEFIFTSETKPGYATAGSSTASAVTTTFSYSPLGLNRVTTTTLPGGGTKIQTDYTDGKLKSITGTGVGCGVLFLRDRFERESLHHQESVHQHETLAAVRRGRTCWAGRRKAVHPGFTGQSASEEVNIFDDYSGSNTGRLIKTTKTGFAPTRYEYNTMSQVVRSGGDLDPSTGLQTSSATDRINDTSTLFESFDGAYWQTTTASNYPTASSSTAKQLSVTRKRLTGRTASVRGETRTYDFAGNETRVTVTLDSSNRIVTTTKRPGMASDQVDKSLDGLPALDPRP